jgi:hypothetical protein
VTTFQDCFRDNTLTVITLSRLYIELEANNTKDNVLFQGGSGQYDPSYTEAGYSNNTGTARGNLVTRGWTLSDGGSI